MVTTPGFDEACPLCERAYAVAWVRCPDCGGVTRYLGPRHDSDCPALVLDADTDEVWWQAPPAYDADPTC